MRVFQVYEHETILVGDTRNDVSFDQKHFVHLSERLGKKDDDVFPYYSLVKYRHIDGVKFKQYVGVLQVDDLTIEILPKADRGCADTDWKSVLLFMLCKVHRLNVTSESYSSQKLRSSTILDFFIIRFLNEVESILHQGLVKAYSAKSETVTALKGRLLFSEQIRKNLVHKERFSVKHTVYDRSHIMNRIIRQTLICISSSSINIFHRQRANKYLASFPELQGVKVEEKLFANLQYDRKTQRYKEVMSLCELLLFNNMPDLFYGHANTFAMLFDMNRLWEEFVYITLRKYLPKQLSVGSQVRKRFWQSKSIKPDIVIRDIATPDRIFVLDTKWKQPVGLNPSDADLHQMYVYYKYFNAYKVALIYPTGEPSSSPLRAVYAGRFFDDVRGTCDLIYLPTPKFTANGIQWQQDIVKMITDWIYV